MLSGSKVDQIKMLKCKEGGEEGLDASQSEPVKDKGWNNEEAVVVVVVVVGEDNRRQQHCVCQHNKGRGEEEGEGQYD